MKTKKTKVVNVGDLVRTPKGLGRVAEYDSYLGKFLVRYENGAVATYYKASSLKVEKW